MDELPRPVGITVRTESASLASLAETVGTPMLVLTVTLVGLWLSVDGLWPELIPWR